MKDGLNDKQLGFIGGFFFGIILGWMITSFL